MPSWLILNRIALARTRIVGEGASLELDPLRFAISQNRIRRHQGQLFQYLAEILMNTGEPGGLEAEQWIRKAIDANERNGVRWNLAMDYACLAEWFKRKGDGLKARENLERAVKILKECGSDGWVSKYQEELASISGLATSLANGSGGRIPTA